MKGELQRVVGGNVRRIRLERKLSQEELGQRTGYHRTYVGGIERGERNLSLQSVEELAERLEVDTRLLLGTEPR